MALNIVVVCGSVRKNRNSIKVANFLLARLQAAGVEAQVVDFEQLPLPFVDSDPAPDQLDKHYPYENVQKWSSIVDAADGLIFVSPEYNHSFSGVLKNAMDWLYEEFNLKPAALVGVSNGAGGGRRATIQLPALMFNFGMYAIKDSLTLNADKMFDEKNEVTDEKHITRADKMISSLLRIASAMRPLRS